MKVILAVDRNFAIGKDGDMLFSIPEDMARFKKLTTSNIVIMGRKTLQSLPGSKPLKDRINIIVTSKDIDGCICVKNKDELKLTLDEINPKKKMTEYLIGGALTIESLIDLVDEFLITYVDEEFEHDAKIRNLFEDGDFYVSEESETKKYGNLNYKYIVFKRK
ncbi:dihydrofolate reductase [uncultured Finegoldia sp.]|uniref:dihydrofolate reductase n=1 Tax=uncultured Finegoldia sp. TaxID=328009 RepID=UPI0026109695|nr:dihydrofolate reductase [uncultured Finegoldia sp.]